MIHARRMANLPCTGRTVIERFSVIKFPALRFHDNRDGIPKRCHIRNDRAGLWPANADETVTD
jgi:hypothetical protein